MIGLGERMKNLSYKPFFAIISIILILLASIIILTTDKGSDISKDIKKDDETIKPVANISYFGNAINDFAFKIFKEIYEENEKNVFISPYSIFIALAMAYEGANGETADEMATVLSIQRDNESFHNFVKNLNDQLFNGESCNVSTANALWVKENLNLLEDYLYVIQNYYDGNSTNIDFSNPQQAADIINQWIENKTNSLIKDLIKAENIDPLYTALILTNAIYFKGNWEVQFDLSNTTNRDFKLASGDIVTVPTMCMLDTYDYFNYTETSDLQILELPYFGNEFSMVLLLPTNTNLSSIVNSIGNDDYPSWLGSFERNKVNIYLPKFELEYEKSLKDILIELGMANAFTSYADFSDITTDYDLWIDEVAHKAFVNVNEEGTEAAAATAVDIIFGIEEKIVFNADHPFIFLIQHKETGTILFMGSVDNPSG